MRLIALIDVAYKLFMTILGKKIEMIETQTGFTMGSMTEDNLFNLQYCIEGSFKLNRPLIVTCRLIIIIIIIFV